MTGKKRRINRPTMGVLNVLKVFFVLIANLQIRTSRSSFFFNRESPSLAEKNSKINFSISTIHHNLQNWQNQSLIVLDAFGEFSEERIQSLQL